jgi:hypothetical protein
MISVLWRQSIKWRAERALISWLNSGSRGSRSQHFYVGPAFSQLTIASNLQETQWRRHKWVLNILCRQYNFADTGVHRKHLLFNLNRPEFAWRYEPWRAKAAVCCLSSRSRSQSSVHALVDRWLHNTAKKKRQIRITKQDVFALPLVIFSEERELVDNHCDPRPLEFIPESKDMFKIRQCHLELE